MNLELELPEGIASWIPARPWLNVHSGKVARLKTGREEVPIEIHRLPSSLNDEQVGELLKELTAGSGRQMDVVVSPFLRRTLRELLEQRRVGYADSQGNLHLIWRNALVHLEGRRHQDRPSRLGGAGTLGANGVRAVQALLEEREPVSVSSLADRARLSNAQTHVVLTNLEREGLIRATGAGPAKRRAVVNRTELLNWVQQQRAARRRERQLFVSIYARVTDELWTDVTRVLDEQHIPHALTGSAAASVFGVGPTQVLVSTVRISPKVPLDTAARALKAEPTERGANVRLIRDTGEVGSGLAELRNGVRVAPAVRVYLDLLSERRGEDLAEEFREKILGY